MIKQIAICEVPAGPAVAYACPTCGGRIEGRCPCGRARTEWLYFEEVIVIPGLGANCSGRPRE